MIFRVGAEYGIINVLGCARKATTGSSIGGPEAAGAANIYTGASGEVPGMGAERDKKGAEDKVAG